LWVLAWSTIVEYSQQEGFYRVLLPAARQIPNLEDHWLERSNSRHQSSPMYETTRANPSSGRWNYGREIAENFAESGDFHVTVGFFYMS
jgi:sulfur transfer protein SufE